MNLPPFQPSVPALWDRPPPNSRAAGYCALASAFGLAAPRPALLVAVGDRHSYREEPGWRVQTLRYWPGDTVLDHIEFALRYEGVDLAILNALFAVLPPQVIAAWVEDQPTGQYARRTWFLWEWLRGERLDLPDATRGAYADVLDPERYYAIRGETSSRHRVRNNLPGTPDFCPLVRRTEQLQAFLGGQLAEEARGVVRRTAPDLMARAAAFLLLEDSKASYVIEGERPPQTRIQRWGQAIGEAGQAPLTADQLLRLQRLVIDDPRFTRMGWRIEGGFVGGRDRRDHAPLPDHISSRADDIQRLLNGVIAFAERSEQAEGPLDPVVAAAAVAFGFVFIHPFEDGNGRIHRWLVHHVLGRRGFNPPGVVFPVSAVFLERLEDYKRALQSYSRPRLPLTEWVTTPKMNVEVRNATLDNFRFFDATDQAEFLAASVVETIRDILPREIDYLRRYDQARARIDAFIQMPDARFDLMMGLLGQNAGRFSQRARGNEFAALTDDEAGAIEGIFQDLLVDIPAPLVEVPESSAESL